MQLTWQHAIQDYGHYLRIERGLSENSVEGYVFDVRKLICFLEAHEIVVSPDIISSETVQQFIYETAKVVRTRSQARLISGLRSFFYVFDF